jgi:hypothetical protein
MPNESWALSSLVHDSRHGFEFLCSNDSRPESPFAGAEGSDRSFTGFTKRLDNVSRILISAIGSFDSMSDDSRETGFFKHGPGAVSNLKGRDYKWSFPNWSEKLDRVFPFDWCSGAPLGESVPTMDEPCARLLAVPKTAKAPRLIASEPVEHQWCQQKIATFLDYRYSRTRIGKFIALHDQSLSQRLVASASHDRRLSTIDLSSASDRIATWHIEALFRSNPELLHAMHAVRTQRLEDGITSREVITLKKFSTMGSALTFPVQSLFFLAVALASCGASTKESIDRLIGKVRVFGDDIIVPTTKHASVVRNLTILGLKVNEEKSFVNGSFRESCGADWWAGFDTTPIKPKTYTPDAPESVQALVDSSNNFHASGYWRTAALLVSKLPRSIRNGTLLKVRTSKDAMGAAKADSSVPALFTFGQPYLPKRRWNTALQREEVQCVILVKESKRTKQDNSMALREFLTRPFSAERPRETGTMRNRAAVMAARWLGTSESSVLS